MKTPKGLLSAIRKERTFVIASHINPDGDAIGSALALALGLESIGKKAFVFNRDPVPRQYSFLPGKEKISRLPDPTDDLALVLVDCNTPDRAAVGDRRFKKSFVVDHHETEANFGDVVWIERHAAATGMMVYGILKALRVKITSEIATNLYTAISIDTGTFRYGNTSAEVLGTAAELVEAGADPEGIARHLYERWDKERFDLLVMTLNTLDIRDGIAGTFVTKGMLKKTGAKAEDTENFANIPRIMDSIRVSYLLREVPEGGWKVSLRSKGEVDVSKVAVQFGGGGHKNAAGFHIGKDLNSAKRAIVRAIKKTK